jgi:mannose-6-phosphate isomerase-like protein (cupin superfamily)
MAACRHGTVAGMTPRPSTPSPQPVVRHAGEGDHAWQMRACITVKLSAEASEDGRVSAAEFLMPAEFGPPLHIHHREDELMQVLEGTLRVVCGEQDFVVGPGAFAFLPRGVPHTFWVTEGPARVLTIFTPGGVEAIFVNSGMPAPGAQLPDGPTVEPGAMRPYEALHEIEMVGPPLGGAGQ